MKCISNEYPDIQAYICVHIMPVYLLHECRLMEFP